MLLIPLNIRKQASVPIDIKIVDSPLNHKRKGVITPFRGDITPFSGDLNLNQEIAKAETELSNTNLMQRKDFVFSSYLSRIKSAVEPGWVSAVKQYHKRNKISNNIVATVVWMIIDSSGLVVDVIIVRMCGDIFLDNLAVSSLKGLVFPNPPKDLLDKDGLGRLLWTYRIR